MVVVGWTKELEPSPQRSLRHRVPFDESHPGLSPCGRAYARPNHVIATSPKGEVAIFHNLSRKGRWDRWCKNPYDLAGDRSTSKWWARRSLRELLCPPYKNTIIFASPYGRGRLSGAKSVTGDLINTAFYHLLLPIN